MDCRQDKFTIRYFRLGTAVKFIFSKIIYFRMIHIRSAIFFEVMERTGTKEVEVNILLETLFVHFENNTPISFFLS
jgi:hypothetical protein